MFKRTALNKDRPTIPPHGSMSLRRMTLMLGALTAFAPLSIDMYLPSFPAVAKAFAVDPGRVQITLSVFFLGLAAGQAIYGPLSDQYGRRRPLLIGVAIFTAASILAAFSPTLGSLIVWRLIQALGGCAGMVISRAIVRDLFDEREAARVFSLLILVMGLAPILAPTIGGSILLFAGWRAIFLALSAFGAVCFVVAWAHLAETLPRELRQRRNIAGVFRTYGRVITTRRFLRPAMTSALIMAGMFAYITGSPFIFINLHGVTPRQYGIIFGLNATGLIAASQLNRAALLRWPPGMILSWAVRAHLTAAVTLLFVAGSERLAVLAVPLWFVIASLGFINPNAVAIAMEEGREFAGSASAVIGVLQFSTGAIAGGLVAWLHNGTAYPMAVTIACASLAGVMIQTFGRRSAERSNPSR